MRPAGKNKSALVLVLAAVVSVAVVVYLGYRNVTLRSELADGRLQCERSIEQVTDDYRAELESMRKTSRHAVANGTVQTAVTGDTGPNQTSVAEPTEKPPLERYDESISEIVARKYRFLFGRLSDAVDNEALRRLLMERERVALRLRDAQTYDEVAASANIQALKYELSELDRRIAALLDAQNRERYELLKDSDDEQKHFNQYALGVNGLFPLTEKQQETVLFARLRHKQTFEENVASLQLDADYPLTETQRDELLAKVEQAAQRYKHGFLQEMHGKLDHGNHPMDQYTLLENYTNTEFKKKLQALREKINERAAVSQ